MGLFAILVIALIASYFYYVKTKSTDPQERKKRLFKSIFYLLIIIAIALALSGRVSWIIAAGAALIPIAIIISSKIPRPRFIISTWPTVIGSKEPGKIARFIK